MRTLALVTARAGSKGFPGKNLALLAGRPLVVWAFRAMEGLAQRRPDVRLHLSTDGPEIAAAWPDGFRPRRLRPSELASDTATSIDVVLHEIAAAATDGFVADRVVLLQPTSPLLDADDLEDLLRALDAGSEAALAVAPPDHPPRWACTMDGAGRLSPLLPTDATRRQDLAAAWMPVGAYAATTDFLRRHRTFMLPGTTVGVRVPALRAVDIDHPQDLARAAGNLAALHPERPFHLGTRRVGGGAPCLVIAEAGVNHNGDPAMALELVRAAARSGADAVKFQAFRTDALVTGTARKATYQQATTGAGDQASMLRRLELNEGHFRTLKAEAERLGLVFLCTPFDDGSADMLRAIGVHGFKLGSGDLTNHPLLTRLAAWGLPLIISSGMSTLDECEDAAHRIRLAGDPPLAWLHCVSQYPAPEAQSNLRAMDSLRLALGDPVGMSDHSPGMAVTLAAVARGAAIIEKHLTLDRTLPGPDHAASVEPAELAELVRQLRLVESALGDGVKIPAACERDTLAVARRSLVAARDLPAGHVLTVADVVAKRPGDGIPPTRIDAVIGRPLARALQADARLSWEDLQ